MSKQITTIVLTGGPCAGKTTAMNRIINEVSQIGYTVLIISETATELINGGIKPFNNCLNNFEFQKLLLKLQTQKETIYNLAAQNIDSEKILIICDRGILDNKAYIPESDFKELLDGENLREVQIRDHYNAVFHLVSASKGAEEFYTIENNLARTETIEEARLLDDKIINAWTGHPHFRIIDNSTAFESKINKLISEIFSLLGEPTPLEIRKKYLIKMPDIKQLLNFDFCTKVDIIQTYLHSDNHMEKRLRQRGINGDYIYTLTTKEVVNARTIIKTEKRISETEYLSMMMFSDTSLHQIIKQRYCFVYNNEYFELDIYPFEKENAILEIGLTNENQEKNIPKCIHVIKEVTEDESYKNYALAKTLNLCI